MTTGEAVPVRSADDFAGLFEAITANVAQVVQGSADAIRLALVAMVAEGHLLIEDVPGVGKTTLAKAIAASVHGQWRRIQFTPDLLPSDVIGVTVFNREAQRFEFRPGGVFANVVLADELNRASPKTQAALLEAMEESQVTVDATTHPVPRPFMVIATQNPLERQGTYPLPDSQLDRFLMRISLGYPGRPAELDMFDTHGAEGPPARDQAGGRDGRRRGHDRCGPGRPRGPQCDAAEALAMYGIGRRSSETLLEHAARAGQDGHLPDGAAASLLTLGRLAGAASYAGWPLGPYDAMEARHAADAVQGALRDACSLSRRLGNALDPRPLVDRR